MGILSGFTNWLDDTYRGSFLDPSTPDDFWENIGDMVKGTAGSFTGGLSQLVDRPLVPFFPTVEDYKAVPEAGKAIVQDASKRYGMLLPGGRPAGEFIDEFLESPESYMLDAFGVKGLRGAGSKRLASKPTLKGGVDKHNLPKVRRQSMAEWKDEHKGYPGDFGSAYMNKLDKGEPVPLDQHRARQAHHRAWDAAINRDARLDLFDNGEIDPSIAQQWLDDTKKLDDVVQDGLAPRPMNYKATYGVDQPSFLKEILFDPNMDPRVFGSYNKELKRVRLDPWIASGKSHRTLRHEGVHGLLNEKLPSKVTGLYGKSPTYTMLEEWLAQMSATKNPAVATAHAAGYLEPRKIPQFAAEQLALSTGVGQLIEALKGDGSRELTEEDRRKLVAGYQGMDKDYRDGLGSYFRSGR